MIKNDLKKIIKLAILLLIMIIGFVVIRVNGITDISPEGIKSFILSFGWKAPFIYILLYTIRPFFLFPASLLSLSGGLAFGPIYGTMCDIVGGSLGAWISFFMSRKLGKEAVEDVFGRKFSKLDFQLEEHGTRTIIYLRLIPFIPFDSISYVAGISKISFVNFAIGTAFGLIPGSFIFNSLGNSLTDIFSTGFYIAVFLVIMLFTIPLIIRKIQKKNKE